MDSLDNRLLAELMLDSRMPVTQLARKLRASREVVNYRLNKLKRDEIILGFIADINLSRLGYIAAAVFVNVKTKRQDEFETFLKNSSFVSWVAKLSGIWSFGFSIVAKNNEELDEKFLLIYNKFKEDIIDHRFTLHKKSSFFYEKYFGKTFKSTQRIITKNYRLDYKDKIILRELSQNARMDSVSLSGKVALTPQSIIQRMRQLESTGYIERYSTFVDISKLGLFQYSIFVINKNINEKHKLMSYLSEHKNVSFIAEYIGDPFVEFGLFVDNPYALRKVLEDIEETFSSNRVIEISLFQKEFVSTGPPACVFD